MNLEGDEDNEEDSLTWIKVGAYPDKDAALEVLQSSFKWRSRFSSNSAGQKVVYFECVGHVGCKCECKIIEATNSIPGLGATLYQMGEHTTLVATTARGIHHSLIGEVDELIKLNIKPSKILKHLEDEGYRIRNHLHYKKRDMDAIYMNKNIKKWKSITYI